MPHDDSPRVNDYDSFAEAYSAASEVNLLNAYYERPATLALDSSAGMLELAWRRLGDDADLHLGDLGRPLPFPDGAFDDVIASQCCTTWSTDRLR